MGIATGVQQTGALFDHLVGAAEKRQLNCKTERIRSLEIDCQLNFCRLLKWQIIPPPYQIDLAM
jgi:hypothetical protein